MSATVTIEEAQARLPELITQSAPGEEIIITKDDQPVAKLHPLPPSKPQPRFGGGQGKLTIVVEDDEHLKDFQEYIREAAAGYPCVLMVRAG